MDVLADKVKETLHLASNPASSPLSDKNAVSHSPVNNATWKETLAGCESAPKDYALTKTLVFKPKVAKTQTAVLIVVVALEDTVTNGTQVAKAASEKEARLAAPDVVKEALQVTVDQGISLSSILTVVSPLSVSAGNASKVQVLVDSRLAASSHLLAFHPSDAAKTVFITSKELQEHLVSTGVKVTDVDFAAASAGGYDSFRRANRSAVPGKAEAKRATTKSTKEDAKIENAALIGIDVRKDLNFPTWYQQVLTKGDMLDYYDVSGCYIMKPWSYSVWEAITKFFDGEIKKMGVENAYFPMFVSQQVLEKEKDHIEGFAPEVAWVTKAGNTDLEKPIAIRPTSETVMYPYYQKWIRSHRDLPLKLNQWNSVVRWEFKHPQPFLRTREFLWQEGHTAFLTYNEAITEVWDILELYRRVYEEHLAVPVIKGTKSENEKFAGGLKTTTVEGFIPTTGRGIQGGTSHCLGQNFSKMFDISVENPVQTEGPGKLFVWQNSWGLSTRTIGVMVMVHGDDKGLVMPPMVSQIQVVIIPCGIRVKTSDEEKNAIYTKVEEIEAQLKKLDVRVKADIRDTYSPGWKFNQYELKGVPIRIEIGPQDIAKGQYVAARRDTSEKSTHPISDITTHIPELLKVIQSDMYNKAKKEFDSHVIKLTEWKDVVPTLDAKNVLLVPWCQDPDCEDTIKERSGRRELVEDETEDERAPSMGAKSLCIPEKQPEEGVEGLNCIQCGKKATVWGLFGRSY